MKKHGRPRRRPATTDFASRATVAVALAAASMASATAAATVSDFVRSQASVQGRAIVDAARAMPADRYGYAPQFDPMTFGQLVQHVVVGNFLYCARIGAASIPALNELTGSEPKDVLVKRLQDSFDFCTRALAHLDDSKMAELLDIEAVKTPRSMAILTLTGTWNVHLQTAHDYLSQNGQRIPASAP